MLIEVRVRPSLSQCSLAPAGSMSPDSNLGLAFYCIWKLSPCDFGSIQLLSWECLLSVSNSLPNSVNICFLHQYSPILGDYVITVFVFLAHFHSLLILLLLNFF